MSNLQLHDQSPSPIAFWHHKSQVAKSASHDNSASIPVNGTMFAIVAREVRLVPGRHEVALGGNFFNQTGSGWLLGIQSLLNESKLQVV